MIALRILGFGIVAAAVIITFIENTNKWAATLRQYFVNQPKTLFSRNETWQRPVGLIISKAMIIFLGFMLIVAAYAFCFGVGA
jgi:uncharacterized membrane protein